MCPVCKKVVEFGVVCDNCASWFHATESCCGDALADAFLRTGKGPWCCLNCFPHVGERPVADKMMAPAATAEVLDWRRAFHIFTDSCAGCGLEVKGEGHLRSEDAEREGGRRGEDTAHVPARDVGHAEAGEDCDTERADSGADDHAELRDGADARERERLRA